MVCLKQSSGTGAAVSKPVPIELGGSLKGKSVFELHLVVRKVGGVCLFCFQTLAGAYSSVPCSAS